MSQQHAQIPRSDVSRRAPLDTGLIRRGVRDTTQEQTSDQYLAQVTDEWHKRVDQEIKSLANGMVVLCQTALMKTPDPARREENRLKSDEDKIKIPKDKYRAQQDAFQARALAENIVLAADSLLTITHSLKLMYLLSDEEEITTQKAKDLHVVREETRLAKEAVTSEWATLFHGGVTGGV